MVRKQVYIDAESDRKLKALAKARGCSESEVLREAIRKLPEPLSELEAALERAGFRYWDATEDGEDVPSDEEAEALQAELDRRAAFRKPPHVAEAIIEDREDRI